VEWDNMARHIWFDMGDTAWDIYHIGNFGYAMRDIYHVGNYEDAMMAMV
jgi:hypothetical protein